jgi:SpoVK/Ycf46/Vps4 family AAA+-type ATPase
MMEATALMVIRKIRNEFPKTAEEISDVLAYYGTESFVSRSLGMSPIPVDKESRYALLNIERPLDMPPPILDELTQKQIDDFIKERNMISRFLSEGITPPNSLLLCGMPGVGKTYIAHWISYKLNLPIVKLDLATSISSYLGRSGQNVRSIFEYAKENPSVLLLDEFDAIAKRRDDSGDLGELKRLVNVILKEIEDYPSVNVLIGATNHPELLDKAIWRRFDRVLTIKMPESTERYSLLIRHLGDFTESIGDNTIACLVDNTCDINSADICKLCEHIKRQLILYPEVQAKIIALTELFKVATPQSKEDKMRICQEVKAEFPSLSQRDISQITYIPLSSVSRYLSKEKRRGER